MQTAKYGMGWALLRYFRFWNWKKARGIVDAADEMYTGSIEGIEFAFAIEGDNLADRLKSAIGQSAKIRMAVAQQRKLLEASDEREAKLQSAMSGCAEALLDAAGSPTKEAEIRTDFDMLSKQFNDEETKQKRITAVLKRLEQSLASLGRGMEELETRRANLKGDEAEAVAAFVTEGTLREAFDVVQDLRTSFERGPVDAVMKKTAERTAQIEGYEGELNRETGGLVDKYATRDRVGTTDQRLETMLAAKRAERAAKQGAEAPLTEKPAMSDARI